VTEVPPIREREAATDVIALAHALGHPEPWRDAAFVDRIVTLQRHRQQAVRADGDVFFDRSPVCTLALSHHLGALAVTLLTFFVRNLGFVRATDARRITFEDSLTFERTHERTYRELGFHLVDVPAGPLPDRAALVERTVRRLRG
jgi:predicted ATPase